MERSEQHVLLLGDVDIIKGFVFETSSLPQIRGGSAMLVSCEDEVPRALAELGAKQIYCSGGSFLFEVPAAKADEAKRRIEKLYLKKTQVATVTIVYEQGHLPSALGEGPQDGWSSRLWNAHKHAQRSGEFARRVAFLAARLAEAKAQKQGAPFLEALPFCKRCELCGRRMACEVVTRGSPGEEEKVAVCEICRERHWEGVWGQEARVRGRFNEEFVRYAKPSAQQALDLEHLVASARRKYIAFVYADGNEIGQLLQQVRSEQEFTVLSKALEKGTRRALFGALKEVCGEELADPEKHWPFEIINIGGDDVTLVIQAGYAWEVAVRFLETFECEVKTMIEGPDGLGRWPEGWPARITASCGIAIADFKYPVRYLESLAAGLLKRAKREAKARNCSALTFLWLANPIAADSVESLMGQYSREGRALTARPYGLGRAKVLIELAKEASRWPRTLRQRWAEALDRGLWASLNLIRYDVARRTPEQQAQLENFLRNVGKVAECEQLGPGDLAPIWGRHKRGGRPEYRTALLDVLELAELRAMRFDVRGTEEE